MGHSDTQGVRGEVPGGYGKAISLLKGQRVKLINTHGSQVVDTWALNAHDPGDYLSMERSRRMSGHIFPEIGDILFTHRMTEMLRLEQDTCPGHHDTLVACCDKWLYAKFGSGADHRNCRDNFLEALAAKGITPELVPSPLNIWMNYPITENRRIAPGPTLTKPGDFIVFSALMDCTMIFSACPVDYFPLNGEDCTPKAVHFEISG